MKNNKDYTKIIKAIANENRKDIIYLLYNSKERMCVNEISSAIGISQSLTSHQLKHLESINLIEGERVGQTICYHYCKNDISKRTIKVINALIN